MGLKPDDILNINGADCVLDKNNIDAIETWKKVFESGECNEKGVLIGFYTTEGEAKSFPPSIVLEALDRQKGMVIELKDPIETFWGSGESDSDATPI